ncbi:MAG: NADH-quinone oxidoreductase subunit C [Bacteroidota bacterium]
MQFEEIKSSIEGSFPDAIVGEVVDSTPPTLKIRPNQIVSVCEHLHSNDKTYFDSLSCLTGIDNGSEKNTLEVVYNLYSIPYDLDLSLSVELERDNPQVDSVSSVWRGANWHEREAYDLLGIKFKNHPDLRRILLPEDWEGYPLRKDYEEPETYHKVKVKY